MKKSAERVPDIVSIGSPGRGQDSDADKGLAYLVASYKNGKTSRFAARSKVLAMPFPTKLLHE